MVSSTDRMQVVATAGHVDHGKSALLRRLTGMEPDRWAEERRRGLTIDLGYVWTELSRPDGQATTVAFVDVPGHDGFLPNMLCGVGVVERILFVVAADDGWSAQSQEHLEILDLLDRRGVAAVVTKADLAGPERTAEVVEDVAHRLASTSLRDTPVLAVDSITGTGVEELRVLLGDRLSQTVDPDAPSPGPDATRLWVDRVFTVKGAGTVATGMLASGRLTVGQDVEVAPTGLVGRVRGLQCLERPVESAAAGMRVAVNLAGIGHDAFGRGDALVVPAGSGPVATPTSTAIDVELRALPHAEIGRRGAWHLHLGTAATTAEVLPLLEDIEPGERGPARLELARPLPVRVGDRFVLREAGRRRTSGGGVVLDPAPQARRRGTERRLAHALVLEQLAAATEPRERLVALVDAHRGIRERAELQAAAGVEAVVDPDDPELTVVADRLVRRERLEPWSERVLAAAGSAPAEHAVEASRLTSAATEAGCPRELAPAIVELAVRQGLLRSHGGRLVHHRHQDAYLAAREQRRSRFLAAVAASPWDPPDPTVLAAELGIPSFEVQELVDEGEVVSCGPLLFARAALAAAADRLREGPGRDGEPFTASDARQAWNTNRRCAMPLLDHLRAVGVTTFDGRHHRLARG